MRVFISSIDYGAVEADLLKILSEHGLKPRSLNIIRDRKTKSSRGFAFAQFDSAGEAQQAIAALDGVYLNNRRLNATKALDGERPREKQQEAASAAGGR